MDPFLGTVLNNALDDAALLLEVFQAWVYSRRRFGAMSLPAEENDHLPHASSLRPSDLGFDVALKALTILLCDRGQILKNYMKAVRRANRRAVTEVARLAEECNAIGNFGDFNDARRVKLTQLNRAEARVRASAERLAELDAQPGLEDLFRVFLTSIANDCMLLPFHSLRVASVMGWRLAWWRRVNTGDTNPSTIESVSSELVRMVRAGLALRQQQHAALGGSEPLSESRASMLITAVRVLLCGVLPVCIQGLVVNAQELVGRIGGDAAAPRGGAVGAAIRVRTGDSWERFHSFVMSEGDRSEDMKPPQLPPARARSRSFETLESVSGSSSQNPGGFWGFARKLSQALALLPLQVVAARCGIAGPFFAFPDLLGSTVAPIAGVVDLRRWLSSCEKTITVDERWKNALWRPFMLLPFAREGALATVDTMSGVGVHMNVGSNFQLGYTNRTGSGPLRKLFEGNWACGLFSGGDACLLSTLLGFGATAGLGLGFMLSFPSILTYYSVFENAKESQNSPRQGGLVNSVWEKVLAVSMTDSGRSRLWEHVKTTLYTVPYSLVALAIGRTAVRLVFGGQSRKEWVRFAARRHFLRKFFYSHSEAFRANAERQSEGQKLRRMKENVAVSFAPETSPVVTIPDAPPDERHLSGSLKKSSFERRRAEHERKEHLASKENGSNGSISPTNKAVVNKSPWGEIRPIEELVDECEQLQKLSGNGSDHNGTPPRQPSASNSSVNGAAHGLTVDEPRLFSSAPGAGTASEATEDTSREDSWASTSSSSTAATRPVPVRNTSPGAKQKQSMSSTKPAPKLVPKLVPVAFSDYEKSAGYKEDVPFESPGALDGKPQVSSAPAFSPTITDKRLREGGSFEESGSVGLNLSDVDLTNLHRRRNSLTRVRKVPLVEHTE